MGVEALRGPAGRIGGTVRGGKEYNGKMWADLREPIAQVAAQYGWPLRSLFRHDATLEDVFVELTRPD